MLLEAVATRFGEVPEDVTAAVQRLETVAPLRVLLRQALTCASLEAFRDALRTVHRSAHRTKGRKAILSAPRPSSWRCWPWPHHTCERLRGVSHTSVSLCLYLRAAGYVCKRPTWTLKCKAEAQPGYVGNAYGWR
jgi:hypothetical protein